MAVTVSVKLLDEEYQISCEEAEVDGLMSSARDLDERMKRIREGGNVFGVDRIAVMAALNIAHENVLASQKVAEAERDVRKLVERVSRALDSTAAE